MADDSVSTHEQFNANDADIVIQSSDNVLFKLHRKHLEIGTGAFPGAEFNTNGEVTHLQESASVLEVLFGFLYPKIQQSLEGLEFRVVMDVAEAAEKYEVFAAMALSEKRLRDFVSNNAAELLAHAMKHNYPKLMNESALELCLSSTANVAEKLLPNDIRPWLRYKEAWKEATSHEANQQWLTHLRYPNSNRWECYTATFRWVLYLDQMDKLSTLKEALEYRKKNIIFPWTDQVCTLCSMNRKSSCDYMDKVTDIYQTGIDSIPPFTDFINGQK